MTERERMAANVRAAMLGIVAALIALAILAERLPRLPRPVQGFMLWIVGRAEKTGRDFVFGITAAQGQRTLPAILHAPPREDVLAEAGRIALCLRVLASMLRSFISRPRTAMHRGRCIDLLDAISRAGCRLSGLSEMLRAGAPFKLDSS